MKKKSLPFGRGLSVQILAITVFPLTILLLLIAFGSYSLHQQDMRALVSERDERAVQSATAALEAELHHRMASISSLARFADTNEAFTPQKVLTSSDDLATDFDGGVVLISSNGDLVTAPENTAFWQLVVKKISELGLASAAEPGPLISAAFVDPGLQHTFIIVSAYSFSADTIMAGAFSAESLATQTLPALYPAGSQVRIYLLDASGQVLFASDRVSNKNLSPDHPGVAEALGGESGTEYVQMDGSEHVIAYSPIPLTKWALLTEEDWQAVVSPSLEMTQMAPLVLVPAFVLALLALWFGVRQIVQPLQRLESKAAALAWGDFETIKESVGGISEVQHLQKELVEMAQRVQVAQEGLHDFIGAITAAQEEERTRLARELHDDTIQAVIALKQRVQLAQKSVKDSNGRQSLRELENLAEQTVENLRRLTRALRPIYLEDLGLVTALEMLARETTQANPLEVEFRRSGQERRLPREVELAFYRIAQEALNNVVHHARARHAVLSIVFDKEITLEVTDDGTGFRVPKSPTELAPGGHFGLLGMWERADLIGAKLEVQSGAGRGTRLSVRLANPSHPSRKKTTNSTM